MSRSSTFLTASVLGSLTRSLLSTKLTVKFSWDIGSTPSNDRKLPFDFASWTVYVLVQSGSWGINILYLSIDWFQVLPYCIPFVFTSITASVIFWPCLYWSIPWDPHGRSIHEILSNQAKKTNQSTSRRSEAEVRQDREKR